jgi:hypothetical protein
MTKDRDITEVLYDVKLRGHTEAYRQFETLEKGIDQTLKTLEEIEKDTSIKTLHTRAHALTAEAHNLGTALGAAHTSFNVLGRDGRTIDKLTRLSNELTEEMTALGKATEAGNEAQIAQIHDRIKLREKELKLETTKGLKSLDAQKKRIKEIYDIRKRDRRELAAETAKGGMDALGSLYNKDFGGAMRTIMSGGRAAGLFLQGAGGERVSAARQAMQAKGIPSLSQAQGVGGKASALRQMAGSGAAGQMVQGQALLVLGKMAATLAQVAATATAVVGIFGVIAKILYDAYAQSRRFNTEILKTQGISALMPKQMLGTAEGLALAEERLKKVRDLSVKFMDNFKLDLKPEDMFALANALDEAGIPAARLRDYATDLRGLLETNQIAAKNLGVGLNEVTGLTTSYMDTLGADLSQVRNALTMITDDAQKSGMSTKRFFNIIQSASSDMAMYNYRIGEASMLLRNISKFMDAKTAEEFMNAMGKGLTSMSATDRLAVLAKATKGNIRALSPVLQREAKASLGELSDDQRVEVLGRLKSMGIQATEKNLDRVLMGLSTEQLGGLSGVSGYKQIEKANLMGRNAKKGATGIAAASADASPLFQLDMLMKSAEVLGSIEDVDDVMGTALVGGDEKRFRMMRSFAIQMRGQKKLLQDAAKKGPDEFERVRAELGFEDLGMRDGKLIGKDGKEIKTDRDFMENMGTRQKEDLDKMAAAQKTTAEKQVEMTKNVVDAIELGMTKILNDIYSAILDIRGFLLKDTDGTALAKQTIGIDNKIGSLRRQMSTTDAEGAAKIQGEIDQLEAEKAFITGQSSRGVLKKSDTGSLKRDSLLSSASFDEKKMYAETSIARASIRDDLSPEVQKVLKKDTVTQEDIKKLQDQSVRLMKDKGIKIEPTNMSEIGRRIAVEMIVEQKREEFMKRTGLTAESADKILKGAYLTGKLPHFEDASVGIKAQEALQAMNVPLAGDVRMVTKGIPLLNMKAGDVVIDSAELAHTQFGGPGALLAQGQGQRGMASGVTFAPVIHINGALIGQGFEERLYRALEDFMRREQLGSG